MKASRASLPEKAAGPRDIARLTVSVRGVVQGVGFRPFVYQLVTRHGLKGWVCNTSEDVKIDVEGEQIALDKFLVDLEGTAPPLAHIESIRTAREKPVGYERFEILDSEEEIEICFQSNEFYRPACYSAVISGIR